MLKVREQIGPIPVVFRNPPQKVLGMKRKGPITEACSIPDSIETSEVDPFKTTDCF